MIKPRLLSIVLFAAIAFGCAKPPQAIDDNPLQKLISLDQAHLFAGSSDGLRVAYAENGLHLLDVESGQSTPLAESSPHKLLWNPANDILATAFRVGEFESRIVRYSADGNVLFEDTLPIAVSKFEWSLRGDLLVTGYKLEVFSFGSNLQQHLYSYKGSDKVKVVVSDSTLKPHTTKLLASNLTDYHPVLFAGDGDELFYVHLHDPPEFAPYLTILSMNWQTGKRKPLMQVRVQELKFLQGQHEDSIVVVTGKSQIEVESWPQAVKVKSSGAEKVRFENGQLFVDESMLRDWGRNSRFQLLENGHFLLGIHRALYQGDGLPAVAQERYNEKKWTLRRWRSSGLITHDEYLEKMKEEQ